MTQLMGRPILDLPGELSSRSVFADLLVGVRTALLGLAAVAVPILALWVVTPYADDTASGAARLAGTVWLLGHGGPLIRGGSGAPVTVTPLLLTVLTAWQLHRAGRQATTVRGAGPVEVRGGPAAGGRTDARTVARGGGRGAAVAVGAGYLMVVAGVALLGASGVTPGAAGVAGTAFRARALPDVLAAALLVALAVGAGARAARPGGGFAPGHGWPGRLLRLAERIPAWAWPPARAEAREAVRRAVLAGAYGLLAAGAVLVAGAALLDAAIGGRPLPQVGGGVAGALGLLLLCVVLLPNAVAWGTAYALGPGFVVGSGAVVAPFGARLGSVPAVPLFQLLPEAGAGGWHWLACLLPLLAGGVPAVLLGRAAAGGGVPPVGGAAAGGASPGPGGRDGGTSSGPEGGGAWHPGATVAVVLAAALLTGAAVAGCGWLAGGALGTGRMAQLGPVPWQAGSAAAAWFAGVGVPGALVVRARRAGAGVRWGGATSWRGPGRVARPVVEAAEATGAAEAAEAAEATGATGAAEATGATGAAEATAAAGAARAPGGPGVVVAAGSEPLGERRPTGAGAWGPQAGAALVVGRARARALAYALVLRCGRPGRRVPRG